ncbi:MAG: hypothetical protein EXS10_10345 [Phycisphaerales bacterium]|nr:hypothetical protein [Phycisphaerales bacterium]
MQWICQARARDAGKANSYQLPYLYSPTTKRFISYDDPQSVSAKVNYANQEGLGGMMLWEMTNDSNTVGASLMDVIYEGMRLP